MEFEPNNLISQATDTNVSLTKESTATMRGRIDILSDVDLYQFQLEKRAGITINLDTINANKDTTNFDSYLRIFDENGNELAFNDDFTPESEDFSVDSYLGFIANKTGNYYVGVSSIANAVYNPLNGNNTNQLQNDFVSGEYELDFNLVEVIPDQDPNSTIAEAENINSEEKKSFKLNDLIDQESDVDIFQIDLADEEGVKIQVTAKGENSELDSYLRVFDSGGNELAFNDNRSLNSAINQGNATTNSTIYFAPENPGEYFVGVSSAGNFDYDAINGNTNLNFSPNTGFSTGEYQLKADILEILPDEDSNNTINEAVETNITSAGERSRVFSEDINSELDVDVYQIQLNRRDGVLIDLDVNMDSELDSVVRIFDDQGNELAFDNRYNANFTEDFNTNSAISFAPLAGGNYFIGVSSLGNADYDVVNGRTNFSSDVTSTFNTTGSYKLEIELESIVPNADPDNTLVEAIETNLSSGGKTSVVLRDSIDSVSDTDIYKFQLDGGEGITFDINAAIQDSDLDSYLRLFDSEGNQLAFDDDDDFNRVINDSTSDSLLNFVADISGEYYVGVSSEGNNTYDALDGGNNFSHDSGFTTGDYELEINISPVVENRDSNNTILEAVEIEFDSSSQSTVISEAITFNSDVDIYKFQLNQGNVVTLDIDAATQDSSLDSLLRLFDSEGNEIVNNDDGFTEDEVASTDSLIEFSAEIDGEYYVGVSSFPNFEYDQINGSTNFSNDFGATFGDYNLTISIADS